MSRVRLDDWSGWSNVFGACHEMWQVLECFPVFVMGECRMIMIRQRRENKGSL